MYKRTPIRLLGIRVDNLCDKDEVQISIFENADEKRQEKIDKTIDRIKEKYGYNLITRAGKMNTEIQLKS